MTNELTAKSTNAQEYKLFIRDGKSGFRFKHHDEGVWLSDEGIGWFVDGASRTKSWSELARVHLTTAFIPKQGATASCQLHFADGAQLSVVTGSAWGHVEDERNERYGRFLDDLHRRIPREQRGRTAFRSGNTSGSQLVLTIVLVIASIFFVLMPFALVLIFREFKALFITLAGAAFVWPLWKTASANEPRDYNPDQIPPDLYP